MVDIIDVRQATDSEIEQIDNNTVKLSGVHISSKQLIDMFGI